MRMSCGTGTADRASVADQVDSAVAGGSFGRGCWAFAVMVLQSVAEVWHLVRNCQELAEVDSKMDALLL